MTLTFVCANVLSHIHTAHRCVSFMQSPSPSLPPFLSWNRTLKPIYVYCFHYMVDDVVTFLVICVCSYCDFCCCCCCCCWYCCCSFYLFNFDTERSSCLSFTFYTATVSRESTNTNQNIHIFSWPMISLYGRIVQFKFLIIV